MGFKPKEDTGKRIAQQQELVFSKEKFIEDVFNDEYILVVGSEVIMNKEEEPTGDVKQYILRALNTSLRCNYKDFNELLQHVGDGIDPIRNLLNSEDDFSYEIHDVSPELRGLLETGLFRFVLTTTFDGYLEMVLKAIWESRGETLRVVNIDDKKSLDELNNTLKDCREDRIYRQPTLFYIFGKAVKDEAKKFVRTDDDAIQIIEKWIQPTKHDLVLKLIRSKKLLALGCKFDDWYFRFFWYILKHNLKSLEEGQVAFLLDEHDRSEHRLQSFLRSKRIYQHGDARTFMSDITQMLTSTDPDNPFHDLVIRQRRRGGIFISYCSKDSVMASQLFFILCHKGFNVWFDNVNLQGGDNYNREIESAIAEAQVFIPLLTLSVAKDLKAGRTDNYYNREWRLASQTKTKRIMPLAINGYDLHAGYHTQTFESIVADTLSGIDLMQTDGMKKLIEDLTSILH